MIFLEIKRQLIKNWWLLFIFLYAVPILITKNLPLTDYPHHLASAKIIRDYHNATFGYSNHYFIRNDISSNRLFNYMVSKMGYLFDIPTSGKIFCILYLILLGAGIYLFLSNFKIFHPYTFLLFLFIVYNNLFHEGFMNYSMGTSICIILIAYLGTPFKELNKLQLLGMFLGQFILFFTHIIPYCVTIFVVGIVFFFSKIRLREKILRLLTVLPSALLFFYCLKNTDFQIAISKSINLHINRAIPLDSIKKVLGWWLLDNFPFRKIKAILGYFYTFDYLYESLLFGIVFIIFVFIVFHTIKSKNKSLNISSINHRYMSILGISLIILFIAAPNYLQHVFSSDRRFVPFFLMGLPLLFPSITTLKPKAIVIGLLILLNLINLSWVGFQYRTMGNLLNHYYDVTQKAGKNKNLEILIASNPFKYSDRIAPLRHFGGGYVEANGGYAPFLIGDGNDRWHQIGLFEKSINYKEKFDYVLLILPKEHPLKLKLNHKSLYFNKYANLLEFSKLSDSERAQFHEQWNYF